MLEFATKVGWQVILYLSPMVELLYHFWNEYFISMSRSEKKITKLTFGTSLNT